MRLRGIEYKYLVAIVFIFGLFMDIMDSTVINVALPTLGREFRVGSDTLEWVVTGYLLSLAVWIPASGWIGDRFGTKKTFLFALAMFTTGSALCGLSQSIGQLIAFRVLQGVGGGMMTPVGVAMLFRAFRPYERAKASALLSIPNMLAPMLGPILGGWLVDGAGWRWIFYINLPVGMVAFFVASRVLIEHKEERPGGFDLWGFVLSGAGLALVLYALSQAPNNGWTAPNVAGAGAAGLACFVALVIVELRLSQPMLALRLFANRMFRSASLVSFMAVAGLYGVIFLLPLYLQQLRGFDALQSGLATFPQALGMGLFLQITSRLYGRVGPKRMMAAGTLIITISSASFLFMGLETSLWWIRLIMFVRGTGMAFTIVSNQAGTFSTIRSQDTGRASSLFNTNRQVSGSFGVAILATVLLFGAGASGALLGQATIPPAAQGLALMGFHEAFFTAVLFGLAGFAFTFLIHDEDAVDSMRRRAVEVPEPAAAV